MQEFADGLKSARVERGLSLDTVAQRSGLSLAVLECLESGEWQRFGAAILLRNYVRSYCVAIGIDPAPLLEKFSSEIAACDRQQEYITRFGKWGRGFNSRRRIRPVALLLMGIALLGVVAGAIWIAERRARISEAPPLAGEMYSQQELPPDLPARSQQATVPEVKRETVASRDQAPAESKEASAQKSDSPSPPAPLPVIEEKTVAGPGAGTQPSPGNPTEVLAEGRPDTAPPEARKNVFSVEADETTWIQVKTGEKTIQSAMLQPGEKREWTAAGGMQIVVGNSGGVRMKWNDRPVNALGKSGRVLRFHLPDPRYTGEQ